MEGMYFSIIEAVHDNIMLSGENQNYFIYAQEQDKGAHSHHIYCRVMNFQQQCLRKTRHIHIGSSTNNFVGRYVISYMF